MITNQNDIDNLKTYNKIYIPQEYNNRNYSYRFNGDYIYIITNNNCYTQYNTTYCNCYNYNYENNVISEVFTCNTNSNNTIIAYDHITSDINYSTYLRNIYQDNKSILMSMLILALIIVIIFTKGR